MRLSASALFFFAIAAACDAASDGSSATCSSRSLDACARDDSCAVRSGFRYYAESQCRELSAPAGCLAKDMACDDALTRARDPDGRTWWFANTCIPADWEVLPDGDGDSDIYEWAACK